MSGIGTNSHRRLLYGVLWVAAMIGVAIAVWVWWNVPWLSVLLFVLSLACLVAIIYAWVTARRVERLLDRPTIGVRK